MLSKEENELITRVGPETPMGRLMRQYWIPAVASTELPEPDCRPIRVRLLCENLIAWRDSEGRVGLVADNCPHRGASLFFGRNEESGLRCVYHGWKFDVSGTCVDMPNEPAESNFKDKVRAIAYPTQERNGVIWAYMGPRQTLPPLPDVETNMLPEGQWNVSFIQRECNWLQALEGDIDTSHFGFLHMGSVKPEEMEPGTFGYYSIKNRSPRYSVVDTEGGTMYGAYRPAEPGIDYWRIAQFIFPFYTMPPTSVLGIKLIARAWVPMDDDHTMFVSMAPQGRAGFQPRAAGGAQAGPGSQLLPNTSDWLGRFRLAANASNDYERDWEAQKRGEEYTGIRGIHLQDQAVTESEGTIYDRSIEHLGTSDAMVIRVRRRLLTAAQALAEQGATPPGVDEPASYSVRAGGVLLPEGADWVKATEELRRGFVEHPELDPAIGRGG